MLIGEQGTANAECCATCCVGCVADRRARHGEDGYDQELHGRTGSRRAPLQELQLLVCQHTLHVPGTSRHVSDAFCMFQMLSPHVSNAFPTCFTCVPYMFQMRSLATCVTCVPQLHVHVSDAFPTCFRCVPHMFQMRSLHVSDAFPVHFKVSLYTF